MGFRTKLTLAVTLLILALAAFFVIFFPREQAAQAESALGARTASEASILATLATASVVAAEMGGADLLRADLERVGRSRPEVVYISVVKADGQVFAEYQSSRLRGVARRTSPVTAASTHIGDAAVHAAVPLIHDGRNVGTLALGVSNRSVATARTRSRNSALLVSAVILALGVVIAWFVARSVSRPLLNAAQQLDQVSRDLVSSAREQEASAAQEAAAVTQTQRSMSTLLDSAQQIADRSSEVLGNAERSTNGSQEIQTRIGDLNSLAEKVTEILATIMQIADKADLLALNASLEGTKAGEAGKGFALVAAEMRRLAESVMESVSGIRSLMKEMRDASTAAVSASQEGTDSSRATTKSAREIALLTQAQREATEQVITSMEEMGHIVSHTLDGVQRSTKSAHKLAKVAGALSAMVNPNSNVTPSVLAGDPDEDDEARAGV